MSRQFFGIDRGLDIFDEGTGALKLRILTKTAAPSGAADENAAPVGSLYVRSGTGELYQKITNNGNSADWTLASSAAVTVGKWRGGVKVLTNDVIANGVRDLAASPFSDDQGTLITAADFSVGDFAISSAFGTPTLKKVTAVAAPNVTFADADYPLANDDTFIVDNYLPDPAAGEGKAIANFNGSIMVKVGDIDWSLATGINLSGSYSASAGNPLAGDTVEQAVSKIDGNVDALNTLSGVAQGATTLGSWTAPVDLLFSATSSIKALFQRIGDLLMQLRGVEVANITTIATVDEVPVATVKACKWLVTVFEQATPANCQAIEVFALNNGTLVDDSQFAKLNLGANFNFTLTVDISGGNMRLRAASTTLGVTVTARRLEVVKTVL